MLGRALRMAVLEQQRGDADLMNELPKLIGEVTEEQIVAAAATLRPDRRAVSRSSPVKVPRDDSREARRASCPSWSRTAS